MDHKIVVKNPIGFVNHGTNISPLPAPRGEVGRRSRVGGVSFRVPSSRQSLLHVLGIVEGIKKRHAGAEDGTRLTPYYHRSSMNSFAICSVNHGTAPKAKDPRNETPNTYFAITSTTPNKNHDMKPVTNHNINFLYSGLSFLFIESANPPLF